MLKLFKKKIKFDFNAFCFILLCTSLKVSLLFWLGWSIDKTEWKNIFDDKKLPSNPSAKRGVYFINTESSSREVICSIVNILGDRRATTTFRQI